MLRSKENTLIIKTRINSYKHSRKHLFLSCSCYDKYKVSTKHFLSAVITQSAEHAMLSGSKNMHPNKGVFYKVLLLLVLINPVYG